MRLSSLLRKALCAPLPGLSYLADERLRCVFPGQHVLTTSTWMFNLDRAVAEGVCTRTLLEGLHAELHHEYDADARRIEIRAANAAWRVLHQGAETTVIRLQWDTGCGRAQRHFIVTDEPARAEALFSAVCDLHRSTDDEIWVFEDGCWERDKKLFAAIKASTMDTLVLPQAFKQEMRADVSRFFESRAIYASYGVPWKRGLLFTGTPGNGKTHAIKALLNERPEPALYVKSLAERSTEDTCHNIRAVFERARDLSPCVLVLEDLDAVVNDGNRSFFLNELDGFESNDGVLLFASTNHPERLDPALVDRPSRFDRKYHFALPAAAERQLFLEKWTQRLQSEGALSPRDLDSIVEGTEGFSFAYLKELCMASVLGWLDAARADPIAHHLQASMTFLRAQMVQPATARPS